MKQYEPPSGLPDHQANPANQSQYHDSQPIAYDSAYHYPSSSGSGSSGSGIARRLAWGFALILTAIASGTLGTILALVLPLPNAQTQSQGELQEFKLGDLWRKGIRHEVTRPVNILVMGIDEVLDSSPDSPKSLNGRSDTMLLVHVNPDDDSLNVLSIPRDTQVEFPGHSGVTKINNANFVGGPQMAADVISHNFKGVHIDRYVRFNTNAFRELVDLLGGVEVYVPQRMYYVDRTQDLFIDLKPGLQMLDGDQAEQFVRFRSDGYGDIGRVQRQQTLIKALFARLTNPSVLPRLPQVIQLIRRQIDTNLSLEELMALASFGIDLDQNNFRMVMLPGRFSQESEYLASYWIIDGDGMSQVMDKYFEISPRNRLASSGRSFNQMRIAVQNASGDPRLVRQVVRYLQDQGFANVYTVQDWPESQDRTQIIVQRGDLSGANRLEGLLGVGQIIPSSTGDLGSDLTIRVGEDWTIEHGI